MKKDNKIAIYNVVETILNTRKYGDLLSYEYLERQIGVKRDELDFTVKMAGIKEILIEFGYVLSCVLGEGYRILYPNEITNEIMNKYIKTSMNKLGKGIKIMTHTDRDFLNEAEYEHFISFEKVLNELYRKNENSMLDAQALLNATKQKELSK